MDVGFYAEQDAALTLKLWNYFKPTLVKENLLNVWQLEMELLPILIQMREMGIRVDIDKAESLKKDLQKSLSDKYVETESLKEERDAKEKEINELKEKITSLEETIAEAKGAPQLIEAIKNIMITKGFLSDKEFDDLLEHTGD